MPNHLVASASGTVAVVCGLFRQIGFLDLAYFMCYVFQIIQVQLLLPNVLLSNCDTGGIRLSNATLHLGTPHDHVDDVCQLTFCGNRPIPLRISDGFSYKRYEGFYIVQVPTFFFQKRDLSCTAFFSAATASIHTPSFQALACGKIPRYKLGAYNFVSAFCFA